MFIFFVFTGNKAVDFLWLHRNKVYNIAALEQLSRIVAHKGKLHVLKIQMDYLLIFRHLWTDWFDLHMQLGPIS